MAKRDTSAPNAGFQEILEFWHKLEFFIPFDLDNRTEKSDWKKIFWLDRENLDATLAEIATFRPPAGKIISRRHLFVGVFEFAELDVVAQKYRSASEVTPDFETDERGLPEGRTCFAQFGLNEKFLIDFDDVSVSTLPWAMGQCLEIGIEALGLNAFESSLHQLKYKLRRISDAQSEMEAGPFSGRDLQALVEHLEGWASYRLNAENPLGCIEINLAQEKPDRSGSGGMQQLAKTDPSDDKDETALDSDEDEDIEIGILNSFYISDIERAIDCCEAGAIPKVLEAYLSPLPEKDRVNLYEDQGRKHLLNALAPEKANQGRWMSAPSRTMSLMQQFAINHVAEMRAKPGLFSVNGPPGTGKTTLLQDVIADNLVARAKVLASYQKPKDAFLSKRTVRYVAKNGDISHVSILKPELTGFGMVVASSNNAAVENISRDLPKSDAVSAPEGFGYLQPVAHKVAAQKGAQRFERLEAPDMPWGMIATALGNYKNRNRFTQSFFFDPIKKDTPVSWAGSTPPQTIFDWLKSYDGPSFAEASQTFRKALEDVEIETVHAARFAKLCKTLTGETRETFGHNHRQRLELAEQEKQNADQAHDQAQQQRSRLTQNADDLSEEERLLDRQAPAGWARFLPLRTTLSHHQAVKDNAARQDDLRKRLNAARTEQETKTSPACDAAAKAVETAQHAVEQTDRDWDAFNTEHDTLLQRGYSPPPETLDALETDAVQIAGLWHSDQLAAKRSVLTCAALSLHEAWLAEVGRPGGGFGGNLVTISRLLNNQLWGDPAPIWESLFMMVPVVSTTFASFERQFSGMGPGSLGWLFIDEAGQAVPQAAVGALMRARRALVIGDPLQIEPVFTVPVSLISALEGLSSETAQGTWSPHVTSVQVLADQANPFGAEVLGSDDDPIWIGSPLRVHRRCCNPMFDLANEIAYQGKMVFGSGDPSPKDDVAPYLGESAWIDVPGAVQGKQEVPAQTTFMCRVITELYQRDGVLPSVYVISPFKEVAEKLKASLKDAEWGETPPTKKDLGTWVGQRIGTVHTFQGKEEDTVFMVLGVDQAHAGAAAWASSKPNILNVALTRAKRRVYVVGDRMVWVQMSGFGLTERGLLALQPDQFLAKLTPSM